MRTLREHKDTNDVLARYNNLGFLLELKHGVCRWLREDQDPERMSAEEFKQLREQSEWTSLAPPAADNCRLGFFFDNGKIPSLTIYMLEHAPSSLSCQMTCS